MAMSDERKTNGKLNFPNLQNSFIRTIYDETEEEDISQQNSYYDYLAVERRYSDYADY